ncbi:MAG TPA: hypothetical protein PLQ13_07980 [Candidatus Krumholzibacteria bacterium]|nr:hypothetical protein [Candidatus Krumholzibacteria bacterium]
MRIGRFEIPDSLAAGHRNARALGAALVLLVAIIVMGALRCDPVVKSRSVPGLVLTVEAVGLEGPEGAGPHSRVLLAVAEPDTGRLRLLLPPPVPRPGDFVPLRCEMHRKGRADYALDRERWLIDGPAQAQRP